VFYFEALFLLFMIDSIWLIGAVGYYSALIIWIIAQRTHHLHGKYSHSWAIGALLLVFGVFQIVGSSSSLLALAGLTALIMPLIVTSVDVNDHRKSGRGLFEHESHCWMEAETVKQDRRLLQNTAEQKV
jgi:hypothetical protein